MNLKYESFELKLKEPFTISRSSIDTKKVVYVRIDEGIGEASPSTYYGENEGTVKAALELFRNELGDDPLEIESTLEKINSRIAGNFSAKAGIDLALHDLIGKRLNLPVHKLLGITKKEIETSYTIGLDTIKRMQEKFDIELLEQPIPPGNLEDLRIIRENTDIPIFVDEWLMTSKDIPKYMGKADGINIKLMKCGGIREALKMIHTARACNLKVMLGCMIESSVGISAAAQIAPLVDYVDLDGNLLISNDPYSGPELKSGKWILNDLPGLGIKKVQ